MTHLAHYPLHLASRPFPSLLTPSDISSPFLPLFLLPPTPMPLPLISLPPPLSTPRSPPLIPPPLSLIVVIGLLVYPPPIVWFLFLCLNGKLLGFTPYTVDNAPYLPSRNSYNGCNHLNLVILPFDSHLLLFNHPYYHKEHPLPLFNNLLACII